MLSLNIGHSFAEGFDNPQKRLSTENTAQARHGQVALEKAKRFLQKDNLDEAARAFAAAYALSHSNESIIQLARIYENTNHLAEAEILLLEAKEPDPDQALVISSLLTAARERPRSDDSTNRELYEKAVLSYGKGDFDAAADVLAELYLVDQLVHIKALYNLALSKRRMNKFEEGLLFLQIFKKRGSNQDSQLLRGVDADARELTDLVLSKYRPAVPVYKKAWLWTLVGAVTGVGVVLAATLGPNKEFMPLPNNINLR